METFWIKIFFLLILYALPESTLGQDLEKDTTLLPYRKDQWIAGLSGNLQSLALDRFQSQISNTSVSSLYDFQISSGKFIKDKFALGLVFSANRSETRRFTTTINERFSIGPFFRYYLAKNPKGAMFLTGGLIYGQIVELNQISSQGIDLEIEIFGRGPGGLIGIGYSHFLTENIGLEVLLRYDYLRVEAESFDRVNNTQEFDVLNVVQSYFGFGFLIVIPEFAF